jgi:hypothetical protein
MRIPQQPGDGLSRELEAEERLHFRDRFRSARYAALADAEGFDEICFAVESLGIRMRGLRQSMGRYRKWIEPLWHERPALELLASQFPHVFGRFEALFDAVEVARNDAMHTGAYARHVTKAAIDLCIGLEDALMSTPPRFLVSDFMVKEVIIVEQWQPVARARQLMLTHSISYLPVFLDGHWQLISEMALARFLRSGGVQAELLAMQIDKACQTTNSDGTPFVLEGRPTALERGQPRLVADYDNVGLLLSTQHPVAEPSLWLVKSERPNRLNGVLSPFELM